MTDPLVLQTLKDARSLIADPNRWTKGVTARDVFGIQTFTTSPCATCFCALGALIKCGPKYYVDSLFLLDRVISDVPCDFGDPVSYYNDTHTHAEVLAMFDRAIALAEAANG